MMGFCRFLHSNIRSTSRLMAVRYNLLNLTSLRTANKCAAVHQSRPFLSAAETLDAKSRTFSLVCFPATAHLVCRLRCATRIENLFTSAHLFSGLHLMSPQRLAPESHPKVNLGLSSLNTIQKPGGLGRSGSRSRLAVFPVVSLRRTFSTNESGPALMKSRQSIPVCRDYAAAR